MDSNKETVQRLLLILKEEYGISSIEDFFIVFENIEPLDIGCFVAEL